jgi:hypothetical protein
LFEIQKSSFIVSFLQIKINRNKEEKGIKNIILNPIGEVKNLGEDVTGLST